MYVVFTQQTEGIRMNAVTLVMHMYHYRTFSISCDVNLNYRLPECSKHAHPTGRLGGEERKLNTIWWCRNWPSLSVRYNRFTSTNHHLAASSKSPLISFTVKLGILARHTCVPQLWLWASELIVNIFVRADSVCLCERSTCGQSLDWHPICIRRDCFLLSCVVKGRRDTNDSRSPFT